MGQKFSLLEPSESEYDPFATCCSDQAYDDGTYETVNACTILDLNEEWDAPTLGEQPLNSGPSRGPVVRQPNVVLRSNGKEFLQLGSPSRPLSSLKLEFKNPKEERRIDPMLNDQAPLSYSAMCEGHRDRGLSEDRLMKHWNNLEKVDSHEKDKIQQVEFFKLPLGFTFDNKLPVTITRIIPGGQAEKLGLRVGQEFAKVGGESIAGKSCEEITRKLVTLASCLPK